MPSRTFSFHPPTGSCMQISSCPVLDLPRSDSVPSDAISSEHFPSPLCRCSQLHSDAGRGVYINLSPFSTADFILIKTGTDFTLPGFGHPISLLWSLNHLSSIASYHPSLHAKCPTVASNFPMQELLKVGKQRRRRKGMKSFAGIPYPLVSKNEVRCQWNSRSLSFFSSSLITANFLLLFLEAFLAFSLSLSFLSFSPALCGAEHSG